MIPSLISVARAAETAIVAGIPGPLSPEDAGPLGFLQNAYLLSLGIAGLLALGSVAYGAGLYMVSSGKPDKLADAWDRILQAGLGVLLLVGTGTILTVVNPGMLSLELPKLAPVEQAQYNGVEFEPDLENLPDSDSNGVKLGETKSCATTPGNCASLSSTGFTCANSRSCTAHKVIADGTLKAAEELGIDPKKIIFHDAYPAFGKHCSKMHFNGCIADMTLPASYAKTCADVEKFVDALAKNGVYALNEYRTGAFAGCGRKGSQYSGGNHLHLQGCPNGTWDGISREKIAELDRACKK